ncbi:MAG: CvpA family protein, partial [Deltaproteobacteria bacterium]|nr:CvpA family protein [Deltaproteobacteria bacterium]
CYFFIRGVFRGLVKEIVGVLGLFVAFWAASSYWSLGAEQLSPITDNPTYRAVLSFIIIYVVIYFLIGLISIFVDKIVKIAITPFVSGLLGSFLGLLKGIVLSSIVLTATSAFIRADQPFFQDSTLWPIIKPFSEQARALAPSNLTELMKPQTTNRTLRAESAPQKGQTLAPPTDFQSLKKILNEHPELIAEAWRDKFRNLVGPEALDPEDIKRFIRDHPNLFSMTQMPRTPQASPTPVQPSPSWPSPAVE